MTDALLFLSRLTELSILTKATLLLTLGLTAAWLAGRSRASVRHLILAATLITVLALPLITLTAPKVSVMLPVPSDQSSARDVSAQPIAEQVLPAAVPAAPPAPSFAPSVSWTTVLRIAWIGGAAMLLLQLAISLFSLRRFRRDGLPWPQMRERAQALAVERGVHVRVEVLLHEHISAPLTCGLRRPVILLPWDAREWSESELRCALVHELEHVRRGDWATQLMARAICACYWFHPLVWTAWRRLCLEAERACDDAVLQSEERTEYADQLVSLARRMSHAQTQPAIGMANRSDLSKRVFAVLDDRRPRGRAGVFAAAAAVIVAVIAVLAIAPVQAVAQSRRSSGSVERIRVNHLDHALYEAAQEGDLRDMERLAAEGANLNAAISGDGSPLIGAARKGQLTAVRWLLDRGAQPNLAVPGDGNPLIAAARQGHLEIVTLLLDRGARVNEVVPDDENALMQASGGGHLEVVKLLVSRGADVNTRIFAGSVRTNDGEWRTALSRAFKGRHTPVIEYLLSVGARQ